MSPGDLAGYERVQPGLGRIIAEQMVKQGDHRRAQEAKRLDAEIEDARSDRIERRIGQFCGLTIGIVAIISGVVAAGYGHGITGGFIGGGGVLGLVAVFITGRPGKSR